MCPSTAGQFRTFFGFIWKVTKRIQTRSFTSGKSPLWATGFRLHTSSRFASFARRSPSGRRLIDFASCKSGQHSLDDLCKLLVSSVVMYLPDDSDDLAEVPGAFPYTGARPESRGLAANGHTQKAKAWPYSQKEAAWTRQGCPRCRSGAGVWRRSRPAPGALHAVRRSRA